LGIGDWAQSPIPNPQSPIPERERGEYNRAKKDMLKKHTQDFWEDQTRVENEWLENFTKLHKEKKFRDEAKLRNTIIRNSFACYQNIVRKIHIT
jgi:hypothetical protein